MNRRKWLLLALLAALSLGVSACSKEQGAKKTTVKEFTEKRAKAIEDFAKRPLDKARQAQRMADDHTKDVDKAIGTMNGH